MTVEQAFNRAMNESPILWVSPSLDVARMKYYDHVFNVAGNGYPDLEVFIQRHTITNENKHLIDAFPDKYLGQDDLYQVMLKTGEHEFEINGVEYNIKCNRMGQYLPELYLYDEVKHLKKISYIAPAYEIKNDSALKPYPNFDKKYSMVWKMDMSQLDISWTYAAKEYYEEMKRFFNGPDLSSYSEICPDNEKQFKETLIEFSDQLQNYYKDGMSQKEYFSAVSQAYERPYTGDTEAFLKAQWYDELTRIKEYLDETLTKLDTELKTRVLKKIKP